MRTSFLILIGLISLSHAEFSRQNGIITDSITKLEWQDDYSDNQEEIPKMAWQNAIKYCENLVIDSKSDWRLPNINELVSIVYDRITRPSIVKVFENTVSSSYWSSTSRVNYNNRAWYVTFETGGRGNESKNYMKYVRCVRDKTEPETITHNKLIYKTVTSPYTGRVWLDRNLGASQACTAMDDKLCYGDYYQWGRNSDGHEKSDSITTEVQATSINNLNNKFIISGNDDNYDWADSVDKSGNRREVNWKQIDGSSVCPVGFRVPSIDELKDETINLTDDDKVNSKEDAYNSFLKIPSTFFRYSDGVVKTDNSIIGLWSTSHAEETYSSALVCGYGSDCHEEWIRRVHGSSVRCIKD